MRVSFPFLVCLCLGAAACTDFPALEGTIAPSQQDAPYPDLVPLDPLIQQARASDAGASMVEADITPRLAALRARANRLRGPVLTPAERARLLRGVR